MRLFITLFLFVALPVACLCAPAPVLVDSIQAVVNEIPITQQELERFIGPDEDFLFRRFASQPETLRQKVIALRESASDFLINREVILHDFKESIKVPESIVDEIIQDRIKEKFPDQIALTKQLEQEGTTREQLRQKFRDQFVVEEMRRKYVPEPIISPRKIENYYMAHRDDFKLEDQIKMRMIVLNKNSPDTVEATRTRAEEILSQIKGGASFEEMARTYSEGSLRVEGGETGWEDISIVNKVLVEELDKLKPGQHSGIIEAPDGFYLLLLEDRHAAHFKPLKDARLQIEKTLSAVETERLSRQWIDRLKKKTFIKYF